MRKIITEKVAETEQVVEVDEFNKRLDEMLEVINHHLDKIEAERNIQNIIKHRQSPHD